MKDTDWGRFPAHNKSHPSPEAALRLIPTVMPMLWDSVHLPPLAGAGWTHDISQTTPPPAVFKWELRRISTSMVVASWGPRAASKQVCYLGEQNQHAGGARQSKAGVGRISLQSPVDME